jgi:NADH-ubiquinone oxidoreductase chain 2
VSSIILIISSILLYSNIFISYIDNGIYIFGSLLDVKIYSLSIIFFIIIITTVILSISTSSYRVDNNNTNLLDSKNNGNINNKINKDWTNEEYPLMLLFCISGAIFLVSSCDLISVFLSIELQSYSLYLICSIYRNSENSVNAGLTYFLLGGLSSCIILLGQSLLYFNTGNTNLENIYLINNIYQILELDTINLNYDGSIINYIQYSFALICVGFLFKISASPFHFWSPDVYDAIPTKTTMFVAIIAKLSILTFLLELVYYTFINNLDVSWINILLYSSILSLIIGSLLGLSQYRIKRLFAYSTISHLGFILLALSINTYDSMQAFIFYLIQYSFSNLNAFIILIAIGYTLYSYNLNSKNSINLKDINYSPVQLISQLEGFFWVNPILSISFIITLFSFVGMPPLMGFFAKQMILSTALNNGFVFISLIAILSSVISAVYYLIIIKSIFSNNNYIPRSNILPISSSISLPISIITLFMLAYMLVSLEVNNSIINLISLIK